MSFFQERDLARRGREVREWLTHDERGRTIRLVVLSLTVSIAMTLMATVILGFVSRRRAAAPLDTVTADAGEPPAEGETAPAEAVGVPVVGTEVSIDEDGPAQAAGA